MQLRNLVKPIDQMSDDELREHVRGIRHRRETVRPAAKRIVEKAVKKVTQARVKKTAGLLDGMSEEDKAKLIALLGGSEA